MSKAWKEKTPLHDSDVDIFSGEDDANDQELEVEKKLISKKTKLNRSKR